MRARFCVVAAPVISSLITSVFAGLRGSVFVAGALVVGAFGVGAFGREAHAAPAAFKVCKVPLPTARASDFAQDLALADLPLDLAKWGLTNCFADEILVLDGDDKFEGGRLVTCGTDESKGADRLRPKDCMMGRKYEGISTEIGNALERIAGRSLELFKAQNVRPPSRGWDEILAFGLDFGKAASPDGPLFIRAVEPPMPDQPTDYIPKPIRPAENLGLEEVDRLKTVVRPSELMYLGLVYGAGTHQIPTDPFTGAFSACGRASPDGPQAPVDDISNCSPGLYSYFDALAQATANLHGPYLETNPEWVGAFARGKSGWKISTWHGLKPRLVDGKEGTAKIGGTMPRIWNAFLDMGGSLLGGNVWRSIGNDLYEISRPRPVQGLSVFIRRSLVLLSQRNSGSTSCGRQRAGENHVW